MKWIGALALIGVAFASSPALAAEVSGQWVVPEEVRTFDAPDIPSNEPIPPLVSKLALSMGIRKYVDLDNDFTDAGSPCNSQTGTIPPGSFVSRKRLKEADHYEFHFGANYCDSGSRSVRFTLTKESLEVDGIKSARYSFSPTVNFYGDLWKLSPSSIQIAIDEFQIQSAIRRMSSEAREEFQKAIQAKNTAIEKEQKRKVAAASISGLVHPAGGFFIRTDRLWTISDDRFDGVATCYPSNICVLQDTPQPLSNVLNAIAGSCLNPTRYYHEFGIRIMPRQGMPFDIGTERPLTAPREDEDYQAATDLLLTIPDREERQKAFTSAKAAISVCRDQISSAIKISAEVNQRKASERNASKITDSINDCRRAVALFDIADERWKESWLKYYNLVKPHLSDPTVKAAVLAADALCWPGEGNGAFPKVAGTVVAEHEAKEREVARKQETENLKNQALADERSRILGEQIRKYYSDEGGIKAIPLGQQCDVKVTLAIKVFRAGSDLSLYRNQYQTKSLRADRYATMLAIQRMFARMMPMSEDQAEQYTDEACQAGKL